MTVELPTDQLGVRTVKASVRAFICSRRASHSSSVAKEAPPSPGAPSLPSLTVKSAVLPSEKVRRQVVTPFWVEIASQETTEGETPLVPGVP